MQGVGRPRDGGDVFVDFLFAFRREESLAEPRAIGGELLAQIDARDAVAGVFAAQDEHLLVHERGEADRGLIERGHSSRMYDLPVSTMSILLLTMAPSCTTLSVTEKSPVWSSLRT